MTRTMTIIAVEVVLATTIVVLPVLPQLLLLPPRLSMQTASCNTCSKSSCDCIFGSKNDRININGGQCQPYLECKSDGHAKLSGVTFTQNVL